MPLRSDAPIALVQNRAAPLSIEVSRRFLCDVRLRQPIPRALRRHRARFGQCTYILVDRRCRDQDQDRIRRLIPLHGILHAGRLPKSAAIEILVLGLVSAAQRAKHGGPVEIRAHLPQCQPLRCLDAYARCARHEAPRHGHGKRWIRKPVVLRPRGVSLAAPLLHEYQHLNHRVEGYHLDPCELPAPRDFRCAWASWVSLAWTYDLTPGDRSIVVALPTAPTPSLTPAVWI